MVFSFSAVGGSALGMDVDREGSDFPQGFAILLTGAWLPMIWLVLTQCVQGRGQSKKFARDAQNY